MLLLFSSQHKRGWPARSKLSLRSALLQRSTPREFALRSLVFNLRLHLLTPLSRALMLSTHMLPSTLRFRLHNQRWMRRRFAMPAQYLSDVSPQFRWVITRLALITFYQRVVVHAIAADFLCRLSYEVCISSSTTKLHLLRSSRPLLPWPTLKIFLLTVKP